jgi:sugar phosphate isomerase/epimerase
MKLGIGTYTYMWSIGVPGTEPEKPMRALDLVEQAHRLGVQAIQFGPNLPLVDLDPGERSEVLDAVRQFRLELELGTEGLEARNLLRQLEFAVANGSRLIRTTPVLADGQIPKAHELERAVREVLDEFEAAEVRLGLENYLTPAGEMAAVFRRLGTATVGAVLDTVNSLAIPEGPVEVIGQLAPFTVCLHVKDFVVRREWHRMGFRVEGRPTGQGQLDCSRVLKELASHSVQANAILELWVPEQRTLAETILLEQEWAQTSVGYLRQLIV